jgi:intracellular septation protein A
VKNFIYAARPLITDFLGSIFFAVLLALNVGASTAAGIGIAVSVGVILVQLALRKPLGALQWASLALVLLAGAATMLTHDPRFVMIKPTLIYIVLGIVMLQRGWMKRYIPPIAVGHLDDVAVAFGYVWSALMFSTAAANLIVAVWFTSYWIVFVGIFPVGSKVLLFAIQYLTSRTIARRRILAQRAAQAGSPARV